MQTSITIIYAYRNRDAQRVRLSLQSLQQQSKQGFEVVFVDYGSEAVFAKAVKEVVTAFDFTTYYYVGHPGLLWNKSKALNYGIRQAKGDTLFIADVDIIFHPETVALFTSLAASNKAILFKLSYLTKNAINKENEDSGFDTFEVKHTGSINGMVLTSKKSLEHIHGFDEFFHFYGSEDVDLFQRLENSGVALEYCPELYFKHQWHPIYNSYDDSKFSVSPRLFNIKRINRQRYFYHRDYQTVIPSGMENPGEPYLKKDADLLVSPQLYFDLKNTQAEVIHFFNTVLPELKGKTVEVRIREAADYRSLKYRLKQLLKRNTQPYLSLKEVNDIVLSKIVYTYRDNNYHYSIGKDLKEIKFVIQIEY